MNADFYSPIVLSLQVAVVAACVCIVLAVPVARWLARTEWPGSWIVQAIVNLPLVLPPVVTGLLLLVSFSPQGWLGYPLFHLLGIRVVLTWWAVLLAAVVVSFPLAVRPIQLAFQQSDQQLEQVARTLGASRRSTFWRIAFPLAVPGMIAGWLLAFARSLGEFGATIMVAGNIKGVTQTIPLAVYSKAHSTEFNDVWPLVIVSIILSCIALIVGQRIELRSRKVRR